MDMEMEEQQVFTAVDGNLPSTTTATNGALHDFHSSFCSTSRVAEFLYTPPPQLIPASPPRNLQPATSNGGRPAVGDEDLDEISASALVKMKAEMDASFIHSVRSQISNLPFPSSSSSDGSHDSPNTTSNETGKPKRKKRKNVEWFLESLMSKVIQKQEQMHHQLMELIEKKEMERISREEAWRRHEMERAMREQEARSQEAARSLALISFIRNALGQDVVIPHPLLSPFPKQDDAAGTQGKADLDSKRWPTSEVQALITLRAALDHKFNTQASKAPVWEEVSTAMASMGFARSAKKCKEKWENINKYYKKAIVNGKHHSENAKSCPYFHELETLYTNCLITNAKTSSPTCDNAQDTANKL